MKKPKKEKAPIIVTKKRSRYTNEIRKCVYLCVRKQVPLHSVSTVIKEVSKILFDKDVAPLPCTSAICNMVTEMGVLSAIQGVDAMLRSTFVNIAWDATTLNGTHLNEVHANTDDGSFALNVAKLPGGTTKDYVDHIVSTLETSCSLYCKSKEMDLDKTLKLIMKSISSTLSDRAAVNRCVSTELEKYVGHPLIELNCNLHPLDSISLAYRKLCKEFECEQNVEGLLLGAESVLVKVIHNITKLKFKENGDPSAIRVFSNNLDSKLLACRQQYMKSV